MEEYIIREFFGRYERIFTQACNGEYDAEEAASLYAAEFIAASPSGVSTGKNDDQLKQVMAQGYEYYRKIGTKEMKVRGIKISPIDEYHCMAHVAWTAVYAKNDESDITIDFEVHYLMQQLEDKPKVFGWISGNEQDLLKKQGVIG